jgi:uncharacterized protein (DUF2252 family)
MRDPIEKIIEYNRDFHQRSLVHKIPRLASSPFGFYRGTYHLFAYDIERGPFRKSASLKSSGPIVADLHTENFGSFRAITNDIVYDINDFDETTSGLYEWDLWRLATGITLAAHDAGLRVGDGLNAAEAMLRSYLHMLERMAGVKKRAAFVDLEYTKSVRRLLNVAEEKSRIDFMKTMAEERERGRFVLRLNEKYIAIAPKERNEIERSLAKFLGRCVASRKAAPTKYTFQDAAFRFAGSGSLGRKRYALLLGKGRSKQETFETLRLIEWKDSLESSLDSQQPRAGKQRAKEIIAATLAFQVQPKRYLGYLTAFGGPMQARELGANDCRFDHKQFASPEPFRKACEVFGGVTARVHLLGAMGEQGPRRILREVAGAQDRFVYRTLAFAASYAEQVLEDYADFVAHQGEIAKAWGVARAMAASAQGNSK